MVQAYVLIQAEAGRATAVTAAITALEWVEAAEEVTGPYDVIARLETVDLDELGRVALTKIQEVAGVTRTVTCTAVRG